MKLFCERTRLTRDRSRSWGTRDPVGPLLLRVRSATTSPCARSSAAAGRLPPSLDLGLEWGAPPLLVMVRKVASSNSSSSSLSPDARFVNAVFDQSPPSRRSSAGRCWETRRQLDVRHRRNLLCGSSCWLSCSSDNWTQLIVATCCPALLQLGHGQRRR
jgi:hypothetical protein